MKTKSGYRFSDLPRDYAGLCGVFLPRPIRDDVDLANVKEVTDALAGHNLTGDQEDYFDMLCGLVEDYEREHVKQPAVSGLDALKHLLDEHALTGADLSRILGGSRNMGGMILRGRRNLTISHVRKLSAYFRVSVELFLCPTPPRTDKFKA